MRSALVNAGFMPLLLMWVFAAFSPDEADETARLDSFDVSKAAGM
jgi:hypothetical protein